MTDCNQPIDQYLCIRNFHHKFLDIIEKIDLFPFQYWSLTYIVQHNEYSHSRYLKPHLHFGTQLQSFAWRTWDWSR